MTKRIAMLLADGFEHLEAAAFTDVFGWANIDGNEAIELVTLGLKKQLQTTFGYGAIVDKLVNEVDLNAFDALAIPGGMNRKVDFYEEALGDTFAEVIQHFDARQQPIASVCVASLSLGAAGILAGRKATIYHQSGGKRKDELEKYGAVFVDTPVVKDGNLTSSTGPGTAIEVAFQLLEDLTGADNAKHIRQLMRLPAKDLKWFKQPQMQPGQG